MNAVAATVEAVADAAGRHVRALMTSLEQRLAELAADHGEVLARHGGDTIAAGGKRLRPLVVFVAAGGIPGDGGRALVRAAAAVELVHSATLVHDDILDAADLRRGRPTVVASAGRAMATATGDLLFSRAFAELARNERRDEVRALSVASTALARGELLQRAEAFDVGVTLERYLRRCELKTAALFQAACELGALEGGADETRVGELAAFGRRIGLAFQLLDDVLDVSGPPGRTGKRRGADLLDGTVTLPLILARERSDDVAAFDLREIGGPAEAEALCDAIEATGAAEDARRLALEMVNEASATLPPLPTAQLHALHLIADGVVDRYA
ncbi:MAG TPA: polyprenyl synthetase family protein [Solirubrobacteraceae bacterium]|nr:polyprenyl synthetase family protein [Solirubrobacteraceae bacterium]